MAPSEQGTRRRRSAYPAPARRRLRVFTLDPTISRLTGSTTTISVPWEPLRPGPVGTRISIQDIRSDGSRVAGVDLDDPALLAQDGLDPDESDPQFRQQMTYAVLAGLLESLDHARGRRMVWRNVWRDSPMGPGPRPMPVFPHRLSVANAFYEPGQGLSFGSYQTADTSTLVPGQMVHGCLSQDILVHEASHAFLHELRPHSLIPSSVEAMAFHEGFADIVAILSHFTLPGLLEGHVARSGADLRSAAPFIELAGEFGRGSGKGQAVRHAIDDARAPRLRTDATTPHERGSVLVSAMFEAFFASYQHRIAPMLRVAGLSHASAAADLPQELIDFVCRQARAAATMVLTMVVRALDYLPPTGITFAAFLDAVVAADTDLYPEDRDGFRRLLVESCRRRAIYPGGLPGHGTTGWSRSAAGTELPTRQALVVASHDLSGAEGRPRSDPQLERSWRADLKAWAADNAESLGLDGRALAVDGGNAGFRLDQDGFPTAVVTARFVQRNRDAEERLPDRLAGLPLIGGATVIATAGGRIRHVIRTPVPGVGADGQQALDRLVDEAATDARAALHCVITRTGEAAAAQLPAQRDAGPAALPGTRPAEPVP